VTEFNSEKVKKKRNKYKKRLESRKKLRKLYKGEYKNDGFEEYCVDDRGKIRE